MADVKIDFVVTWLDASDPAWLSDYESYSHTSRGDKGKSRFRDMDLFRFWFRAVEAYAPWVNKVYLVTNGRFPDWINPDHPKLVLVSHRDFMPAECLPTFNSCAIELHMHRIPGLSEHFVYFNDDVFLNAPATPDYYFRDGLPCDRNKETCFNVPIYTKNDRFGIHMSMMADIGIVNAHFDRWQTVCQSPRRWFGSHLGLKGLLMSLMIAHQRLFVGFSNYHLEQAFLKSVHAEVWAKNPDFLNASCTRFRETVTANPYLFRYWQFASNRFYPMKRRGESFMGDDDLTDRVGRAMDDARMVSICVNDNNLWTDDYFEDVKQRLHALFTRKFPHASSFEQNPQ